MEDTLAILKAVAEKNRLRVLMALDARRELCVCQIIDLLRLSPATVSRHMSVLTNAKLVASRKQGKWVYYFLPARLPTGLRSWLASSLKSSAVIKADHGALNKIVASTSESLCKKRRLRSALNRR